MGEHFQREGLRFLDSRLLLLFALLNFYSVVII